MIVNIKVWVRCPIRVLQLFFLVLTMFSSTWECVASSGQLNSSLFVRVAQSSDAAPSNVALKAVDGVGATFSLTGDVPGSFWTAELGRPYALTSIELVNRTAPNDREMDGLTLRLFNIDDQIVFQTGVTNPGSGGTWTVSLPAGKPQTRPIPAASPRPRPSQPPGREPAHRQPTRPANQQSAISKS